MSCDPPAPPVPPVLRGLVLGDPPPLWERLGFAVIDDRVHLGGVCLHLTGAGGGILGWELDPAPPGPIHGLAPSTATLPRPAPETAHPNGVSGVDHVVVATPDHERTADALASIGLHPRRTVDGARGDSATRYRFTLLGTGLLEVIGPVTAAADPGEARFVGLALVAPDLTVFGEHAGEPQPAVQPGRDIVTLRSRPLGGGVPLAVLTPRAPRPG